MRVNQKQRNKISRELGENIQPYHEGIPVEQIDKSLQAHGFFLAQEDGTPFGGFFCGAEGQSLLRFAPLGTGTLIENAAIALTWHKMNSGRYEIVCYLS